MNSPAKIYKKVALLILDGFGVASASKGNAISLANPQNLNHLLSIYPALTLQASGPLVGLPWGEMGNSEVGHLNIGGGRIVAQDLPRITAAIQDGEFFKNPVLIEACAHVKQNKSKLHLLGMISPGEVHSYGEHLYALLAMAVEQGVKDVFIHMITDGRDSQEKAAMQSLEKLHNRMIQIGAGKVATISGRFYAMDRGRHWEQTETTYQAIAQGVGEYASSPIDCIAYNYAKGIYDEMIKPTVIIEDGKPVATVGKGDSVIFFNFRQDRAIQLTQAFVTPDAMEIQKKHGVIQDLYFATMTSYMDNLPVHVVYGEIEVKNDLANVIAKEKLTQFHAAESEKFAHVTSFFNGGKLDQLPGEERLIIQSPDNAHNYIDHPEMSVAKLTDAVVEKISKSDTNFYVINFANPDMVGHTGDINAAIKAVHAVDEQVQRIADAALQAGGALLITADHGNCERMINQITGEIDKDHDTSPVPFILVAAEYARAVPAKLSYDNLSALMPEGSLSDIAPTILALFGIPVPAEMTGISLLDAVEQRLKAVA